jgi:SAM-dependent methyltransferase
VDGGRGRMIGGAGWSLTRPRVVSPAIYAALHLVSAGAVRQLPFRAQHCDNADFRGRNRPISSITGHAGLPLEAWVDWIVSAVSTYDHYRTNDFELWAHRGGLIAAEKLLFSRFLEPGGRTLEAGTGGGRLLLELHNEGFTDLHGFDFLPEFIEVARQRDARGAIDFRVGDAKSLDYPSSAFDQIIYLQQIVSFIESAEERRLALSEANRIVKPDGVALFSFSCLEARLKSRLHAAYGTYLRLLRLFRHRQYSLQRQPWLRASGRVNPASLLDRGPYVYWYRLEEAARSLEEHGFVIIAATSTRQAERGVIFEDHRMLTPSNVGGMIYFVCTKPRAAGR